MAARRNPPWADEELILALDLYLRLGMLDDEDAEVIELSRVLNSLEIHADRPDRVRFRNPNGVALKLANLAAHDPDYPGVGLTRGGKRDAEIFHLYAGDEDTLRRDAARIRSSASWVLPASDGVEPVLPTVVVGEVEDIHQESFEVTRSPGTIQAERREQRLVHGYRDHLEKLGHSITRHTYPIPGTSYRLACDLFEETDGVLYEAKGATRRETVRMALGQLSDYQRFEPTGVKVAVLLPRRPSADLLALLRSAGVDAVWKTCDGYASQNQED